MRGNQDPSSETILVPILPGRAGYRHFSKVKFGGYGMATRTQKTTNSILIQIRRISTRRGGHQQLRTTEPQFRALRSKTAAQYRDMTRLCHLTRCRLDDNRVFAARRLSVIERVEIKERGRNRYAWNQYFNLRSVVAGEVCDQGQFVARPPQDRVAITQLQTVFVTRRNHAEIPGGS
jgi:hypothetical protein